MNKNCGIYKITSPTGRIYIGQAIDIEKRRRGYFKPTGAKGQPRLKNSFLKHGIENHQFDVIEYCSEEELNCSERFWQDEFDVTNKNGLNCLLTKCGEKRHKHSEETKKKIANTRLERGCNRRGKAVNAKIVLCTETGIFYECLMDACDTYGFKYVNIKRVINRKNNLTNKTSLIYIDDCIDEIPIKKEKSKNKDSKIVIDTVSGVEYESIKVASQEIGINYSTLRAILQGVLKNKTNLILKNEKM